jgi:hypothetical protein
MRRFQHFLDLKQHQGEGNERGGTRRQSGGAGGWGRRGLRAGVGQKVEMGYGLGKSKKKKKKKNGKRQAGRDSGRNQVVPRRKKEIVL